MWKLFQMAATAPKHSGLAQWGRGGSEGMSEICSNCEIFNTGMSMELISANLTLFLTVLNCVEVRRCPHSVGWGETFCYIGGSPSQKRFKIFDLDLPQPVPPLFHSVPTVWDHRSLQIAILANLGSFWAVFGPWRSQI